jgi:CheY-like chemotaxis protein
MSIMENPQPRAEAVDYLPLQILLVEDNLPDIRLTEIALREGKLLNKLHTVMDGEEALDFLNQKGSFKDAPEPDIILLDLNLPRMDGHEVLKRVKTSEKWKHIPVIILTTSNAEQDILESYRHYANSYLVKPISVDDFINVIRQLGDYWIGVVKLPPKV